MTPIGIDSLASFKRFLAMKGATIEMIKHSYLDPKVDKNDKQKAMYEPRKIAKVQSNGVQFSGGSWLYFDHGAKGFKFDGSHRIVVSLFEEPIASGPQQGQFPFNSVMEYNCYVEE